ncbi:hypothetical protein KBD34_04350 [Patescibacteria group bacterium]|nr:hypothetical protein [Patescibacteria group bacterium]
MPSAPRNVPPRPTVEEARKNIERLEPLIKQVEQEIEALEGSDGRLTKLRTSIALLEADLRDEQALKPDEQNELLIEQIKGELIGLRAALPLVQKELWRLMDVCEAYMAESDEAAEVVLEGGGAKKDRPPEYIVRALADYEAAFEPWSQEFAKLRAEQHVDGIEAVEKTWFPARKAIADFVADYDVRKSRGMDLDLAASEKLQPQLAEDKMKVVLAALADLPAALNPDPRRRAVEQATDAYRRAFALVKEAEVAGARPARKLQLLKDLEATIPDLRALVSDSLTAADFEPFKKTYEDKARALNATHIPAIRVAEKALFEKVSGDPAAREALVVARMGEAAPVIDPRLEALEQPEGQSGYYVKFLDQLGLPLELTSVRTALDAREADAKSHAGTVAAATRPITDRLVVDAWKQDVSVLLGQNTDAAEQRVSGERLARLNIRPPNERLLQVLAMAANPLDGEEGARTVKKLLDQYLDDLLEGDQLTTDDAKLIDALSKGLLDLLLTNVPRVFSGEVQAEQKAAVVDPSKRALPSKEYLAALAKAEGVVPATAPDRAADRAREVAWVSKFIASMDQVKRLEAQPEMIAVQKKATEMNEAGQDYAIIVQERTGAADRAKQLREDRKEIVDIKAKVEEINKNRGPESLSRKRLQDTLKRRKDGLLGDVKTAMEKEAAHLKKAEEAVSRYEGHRTFQEGKNKSEKAHSLIKHLIDHDIEKLRDEHSRDPQSLAWLRSIRGISFQGGHHDGEYVLQEVIGGEERAVLFHFPTNHHYIPQELMGIKLKELKSNLFIIPSFFEKARRQVREVTEVLEWFKANASKGFFEKKYQWRDRVAVKRQADRLKLLGIIAASVETTGPVEEVVQECFKALQTYAQSLTPTKALDFSPTPDGCGVLIRGLQEGVKLFGASQALAQQKVGEEVRKMTGAEAALSILAARLEAHGATGTAQANHDVNQKELDDLKAEAVATKVRADAAAALFKQVSTETVTDELLAEFDQETKAMLAAADPDGKLAREATLTADIAAAETLSIAKGEALKLKREKVQTAVTGFVEAYTAWLERHERTKLTAEPTETERNMVERLTAWGEKIGDILQKMGAPTKLKATDLRNWWRTTSGDATARNKALNNLWPGLFA